MHLSAALTAVALWGSVAWARPLARDQLAFVGDDPPVVWVVVFQREQGERGPVAEAKAFLAWDGTWRAPYWERVALSAWPGEQPEAAVAAWRDAGGGTGLRLDWDETADGLALSVRTRTSSLRLEADSLVPAAPGSGPHGAFSRRTGPALLWVDDTPVSGVVAWEQLTGPTTAQPIFGVFEMWVLAPSSGGLVWGRDTLSSDGAGTALVVDEDGAARTGVPFSTQVRDTRTDGPSGRALPQSWQVAGLDLVRVGGDLGRGTSAAGGVALYDVSLATGPGGQGLVFHLDDQAGPLSPAQAE